MVDPPHAASRIVFVFYMLLGLGTTAGEAQARDIREAPESEKTAHLWKLVRRLHRDTIRIYQVCDSLMAATDEDDLLHAYADLHKVNTQKFCRFEALPERIAFLRTKQAHFMRSPHPIIRAVFCYIMSNVLLRNSEFREAFKLSFRARQIFEEIGFENTPEAALILDHYFFVFYYFEDYRTAITYSELAEKYDQYDLWGDAYLLSNRGEAYLRMGDYPKAEKLFLQAMEVARDLGKEVNYGVSSGNYGNTLRLEGRYKEALPFLYQDVAINQKTIPQNSGATCLSIAYCLIQLDSLPKARTYIDWAERLVYNSGIPADWHWGTYGAHFYRLLHYEVQSLYFQQAGSLATALQYKDSLMVLRDSLNNVFDDRLLMKAEAQHASDKYMQELETIEQEKVEAIQRRNLIVTAVILLASLFLYWLNYRRRRERKVRQLEKQRSDDLLAHATEQLAQYVENLKTKNALIEDMSLELAQHKPHLTDPAVVEAQIDQLRHQVILTEEGWQDFKELFQRVYPNFFDHLEAMPGDFSPAEIRLLALLKLNVPSHGAANMLGISLDSLRKARYRLRKKVEFLPADFQLSDLIGPD